MADFEAFPKIPRLKREAFYTEKIDGTNAAVVIDEDGNVTAQSRKRLITPDDDNFGFAAWVSDNVEGLKRLLGPGRHFGEWWGKGIQRGYGLDERRFSLFNTSRWDWLEESTIREREGVPPELHVVPVLYQGQFSTFAAELVINALDTHGSQAAPGFMKPEGIIVYHTAANQMFKYTIENDDEGKERGNRQREAKRDRAAA